MKGILNLIFTLTLFISCSKDNSLEKDMGNEINRRIDILNNSFKFKIIPINHREKNFEILKLQIDKIVKNGSRNDLTGYYDKTKGLFQKYGIDLPTQDGSSNSALFNILLGLDNLIFKYVPSRLNFSDYKTLVVPNKFDIKSGDEFKARIYLIASDSLYNPEVKYLDFDSARQIRNVYNLPCNHGVGEYNSSTHKKGIRKINGQVIYSNEFGYKDTIDWNYTFEIK